MILRDTPLVGGAKKIVMIALKSLKSGFLKVFILKSVEIKGEGI